MKPDQNASDRAAAPPPPRRRDRLRWLSLALAVLALFAVAAVLLLGYRQAAQMQDALARMQTSLQQAAQAQQALRQQVERTRDDLRGQQDALAQQRSLIERQQGTVQAARAAFNEQEQRLAQQTIDLEEREAELRAAVADVHRRVGRSGNQWIVAETEYLIRIASDRLTLARDAETARVALELADQRLRDTHDPGWTGVRAQLARDIAALDAYQAPDLAGLSARLGALIDRIPQLEIKRTADNPQPAAADVDAEPPAPRGWDTLLDDLWGGLKDSVRIRRHDAPVQALLEPEQRYFLYENLKLHLEAARLALAHTDQALFRDRLDTAADWLGRHFSDADGSASSMAAALEELRQVEIRPPLPDISQSLRALQARRELLDDIAPGTEAAS